MPEETTTPPRLSRRSENRRSTIRSGRTIAESREKLETASERAAAYKKIKNKKRIRLVLTVLVFAGVLIAAAVLASALFSRPDDDTPSPTSTTVIVPYSPTIEIIDEDSGSTGGHITSRMKEYVGQTEADFRELGYTPTKVVVPSGAIREVDFYLDGHPGFIKLTIDRPTGVSVEDADRMIRYLAGQGITDYSYIDVRIDRQAYWK